MNQQEKWVDLFKQVIGRVPSPQEFMAGKESGFDFKQIKSIAGLQVEETGQAESPVPPSQEAADTSVPVQESSAAPNPAPAATLNNGVVVNVGQSAPAAASPAPRQPWSKNKKQTVALIVAGLALVLALIGGYLYMDSKTGPEVAASEFLAVINKEDYSTLAEILSSDKEKWKQADARNFVAYLDSQTNLAAELEKMAYKPSYSYSDDKGNKLIGLEKTGDFLGLFPTYKVTSYPVEVFVQTNLDTLVLNKKELPKGKEISLGSYAFIEKSFKLTGKTDFGQVDTEIVTDVTSAENNEIHLSLNSVEKTVKANLPDDISGTSNQELFINDKEVAKSLDKKIKVLENQALLVYAQFTYEGDKYKTDEAEVVVSPNQDRIEVNLTVSDETASKLETAKKKQSEKEAAAKKEKETEANITSFMNDYIEAMRDSIRYRQNQFAQYYDTNSAAYQTMDDYVSGGDVARFNIDYQTTLDYTVTNISKEGDDYVVTVHNKFREVYMNGKSDIVEKNQVFKLRPNGSSFLIYDISEY